MSSLLPTNQTPDEVLRDYDVYILWMEVWVVRLFKIKPTDLQNKALEAHAQMIAAVIRQDIQVHDQQRDKQLRERLMNEMSAQRRIGTSAHGICCTCQTCKNYYRECECEFNNGVDQAIAAVERVYGDV